MNLIKPFYVLFTVFVVLIAGQMALPQAVLSSETDAFTPRYMEIADALIPLNREMNRRLAVAASMANRRYICSERALDKALKSQLRRPFYGKFEGWINSSPYVPRVRIPLRDSIYGGIHFWENIPDHLGMMGFGSEVRIQGILVGSDKFGHFMDEGYHYYESVSKRGMSIRQAMQYGINTENGIFGIKTTGVKSFADMTANFNGMIFWSRILGRTVWENGRESEQARPDAAYFRCEEGQWVTNAKFDWADYIDAAWDEGVNCSAYRSPSFASRVSWRIQRLERVSGKRYTCPVIPSECARVVPKYGRFASYLLSAPCKAAALQYGAFDFSEVESYVSRGYFSTDLDFEGK